MAMVLTVLLVAAMPNDANFEVQDSHTATPVPTIPLSSHGVTLNRATTLCPYVRSVYPTLLVCPPPHHCARHVRFSLTKPIAAFFVIHPVYLVSSTVCALNSHCEWQNATTCDARVEPPRVSQGVWTEPTARCIGEGRDCRCCPGC